MKKSFTVSYYAISEVDVLGAYGYDYGRYMTLAGAKSGLRRLQAKAVANKLYGFRMTKTVAEKLRIIKHVNMTEVVG